MLKYFPMGPLFVNKYSSYARHLYKPGDRLCVVEKYPLLLNLKRSTDLRRYWNLFEPDMTNFFGHYLKPGMKFLDVGAHKGTYSMMASSLVGFEGAVVAIEPKPENCQAFTKAMNAYDLEKRGNIVLHSSALSSNPGTAILSVQGTHIVEEGEVSDSFSAEATTLDEIISKYGSFDLIKIDTDGHELNIIYGAKNSLLQGKIDNLLVEVSHFDYQNSESLLAKLEEFLSGFGFKYRVLNDKGRAVDIDDIPSWHRTREMHVLFYKRKTD